MSGMAEVLAAHGYDDLRLSMVKGKGMRWYCKCGADVTGDFYPHVEDMLTAAGFGPVKEAPGKALIEAAEEIERLRIIGRTPYTECTEYEARAWWAFAEVKPEEWLRARVAEQGKP